MVVSKIPTTDTTEGLKIKNVEENLTLEFKKKEELIQNKQEDISLSSLQNVGVLEEIEKNEIAQIENKNKIVKVETKEDTDYQEEFIQEQENIEEIIEHNIIDEKIVTEPVIIEEEKQEIESTPKIYNLDFEKRIESGLQIQFTSLKLNHFPIIDSNLSSKNESVENVNFNNINLLIGNEVIYNVDLKIHNYQKFRMLELRTRELKIAVSVILTQDNSIEADGNGYFRYEIFSKVKNSRLFHIIKLFQKIFSGDVISFTINDLKGAVSVDNRIQYHKFAMLETSLSLYLDITKKLHLNKSKNLSETNLSLYTLYLLDKLLKDELNIDSWINFSIKNEKGIKAGDYINFVKVHKLDIRGIKFDLKETIHLKDPVKASEIAGDMISCYKKTIKIKLEKVERK